MSKYEDLPIGTKVEDKYGAIVIIGSKFTALAGNTAYKVRVGIRATIPAEYIKRVISYPIELVDGIDALIEMKQGKYALLKKWGNGNDCEVNRIYKLVDGKVRVFWSKNFEGIETKFEFGCFLKAKFEILDEIPEWAQESKNPFVVGDIVIRGEGTKPKEVINMEHTKSESAMQLL